MPKEIWQYAAEAAARENSKAAGVVLLVVGFFLAPFMIGIPIMCFGFYKLCKSN